MEKLKHLEHLEDHIIDNYHKGFQHAFKTLDRVHRAIVGRDTSKIALTTKYDGSPSIIFGTHPENGKFFVATKSAFNKTPKISHTPEAIDIHHGDKPDLVKKLKTALEHLPKVTPKGNIYQGDILHTSDDLVDGKGNVSFRPNTITYHASKNSLIGKRVSESKIGVAVHTKYKGSKIEDLKAEHGHVPLDFDQHKDVHVVSTHVDVSKLKPDRSYHTMFKHHIGTALKHYDPRLDTSFLDEHKHKEHLKRYINKCVKDDVTPSLEGYVNHFRNHHLDHVASLKLDKNKQARMSDLEQGVKHIEQHAKGFTSIIKTHQHLQRAKNQVVSVLNGHSYFKHSIEGKETNPEGFVATVDGVPSKLVHRHEFSKHNLNREREK